MPDTHIRGDSASRAPRRTEGGWLNSLERKRGAGPFLPGQRMPAAGRSTTSVHAGTHVDKHSGAVGTPIYQASTFVLGADQYGSIEEGFARDRFIYSRYGNPSQWAVQEKLAALEGAESAIVFSSGMAAITATVMALLDRGAHVVASADLYGGSWNLFNQEFPSLGMSASLVDPQDFAAIEAAIRPETQLLYFEAITNPLLKIVDIPRLAEIARRHGLRLVIDATFAPPVAMRSLEQGADVVVHSASKYLNGHSDLIAGVAAGPRKLIDMIWPRLLNFGGSLDPHACFLLERGLKTLAIRMRAHEESAHALARYLEGHPKVSRVFYPLLESHPDRELARRLLKNGTGNVTFFVEGGDAAALALVNALRIPRQATSLGGVESLVSLPFNTSQASYTARQRAAIGIHPGCVRLSVGIEDAADLIADFEQALARISAAKEAPMRNSLPTAALSEFVNEVTAAPEEAVMDYGVLLDWESGTRSRAEAKPMRVGPHRVSRSFTWKVDEPRQLMGFNHGPNPQELLLSGLGACMMVAFVAGATAEGIQLESLRIELDATLDLRGFLGIGSNASVGFPEIRYKIHVSADASDEQLDALHARAMAHSPNAQTILNPVALKGEIISNRSGA